MQVQGEEWASMPLQGWFYNRIYSKSLWSAVLSKQKSSSENWNRENVLDYIGGLFIFLSWGLDVWILQQFFLFVFWATPVATYLLCYRVTPPHPPVFLLFFFFEGSLPFSGWCLSFCFWVVIHFSPFSKDLINIFILKQIVVVMPLSYFRAR